MACGTTLCCNTHGNITQDSNCEYSAGGILNLWLLNVCEISQIQKINGVFQGAFQVPAVPPPAKGTNLNTINEILDDPNDFSNALYQDGAVSDIIMKDNPNFPTSPIAKFRAWNIQCAPWTTGVNQALQGGGGGNTAIFFEQKLNFVIRRVDQYAANRIKEIMAGGRFIAIIETAAENKKLGQEVSYITGNSYVAENKFMVVGGSTGLIGNTAENKVGPAKTDPNTWAIELLADENSPVSQLIPIGDANYNNSSPANAGKYITGPFVSPSPYTPSGIICNLITKLTTGRADS